MFFELDTVTSVYSSDRTVISLLFTPSLVEKKYF